MIVGEEIKMIELSVIMPTYKAASFIEPTLKSIFKQKNCTFELVITNDSPEDHEELESVLKTRNKERRDGISFPRTLNDFSCFFAVPFIPS